MQKDGTKWSGVIRDHSSACDSNGDRAGVPPPLPTQPLSEEQDRDREPTPSSTSYYSDSSDSSDSSDISFDPNIHQYIPVPPRSNTDTGNTIFKDPEILDDVREVLAEALDGLREVLAEAFAKKVEANKVEHAPRKTIMRRETPRPSEILRLGQSNSWGRMLSPYPQWLLDHTASSSGQPSMHVTEEDASASLPWQPPMRVKDEVTDEVEEVEGARSSSTGPPKTLVKKGQPSPRARAVREASIRIMVPSKHVYMKIVSSWPTFYEDQKKSGSKHIRLYTCGLREMHRPKCLVVGALRQWYDVKPDSVLDATIFKKQEGIEYSGEHVAFLRTMCKDQLAVERFFLAVQQLFREDIENRLAGRNKRRITIVIFSDLGKHRSRAMARLLNYILARLPGYKLYAPHHLCSESGEPWRWENCQSGCLVCGCTGSAKPLLDKALEWYITVQEKGLSGQLYPGVIGRQRIPGGIDHWMYR